MKSTDSNEKKYIRRRYKVLAVKKGIKNVKINSTKLLGNIILGLIEISTIAVPSYMLYNDIIRRKILEHSELYQGAFAFFIPLILLLGITWNFGGFSEVGDVSFPFINTIDRIHNNIDEIKKAINEANKEIKESKTL